MCKNCKKVYDGMDKKNLTIVEEHRSEIVELFNRIGIDFSTEEEKAMKGFNPNVIGLVAASFAVGHLTGFNRDIDVAKVCSLAYERGFEGGYVYGCIENDKEKTNGNG